MSDLEIIEIDNTSGSKRRYKSGENSSFNTKRYVSKFENCSEIQTLFTGNEYLLV